MNLYLHDCRNSWEFFGKIRFIIIHPHERYWSWKLVRWNTRFNRLKIGDRLEFTFGGLHR